MSNTSQPSPPPAPSRADRGTQLATGGTVFAGVLMSVLGLLSILQGIVALTANNVYVTLGDYVYEFNLTAWGWIHLILGVVLVATGYGLLSESSWARPLGVALASLAVIANFMFLPYQPVWSLILIAIGVFVIWSLTYSGMRQAAHAAHTARTE